MKETNTGKILTAALAVTALYVAYKNYKNPGFWCGVGAMFLIGISIKTYTEK